MVSANASKELQNGRPKCNPFALHILYDVRRDGMCEASRPRNLTTKSAQSAQKLTRDFAAFAAFAAFSAYCALERPLFTQTGL